MSPLSDEHLVKSCKAGNREHSRLLYERYKTYVSGMICNITGDAEESRDLTQETFLRVFTSIRTFRGDASFKTWVTRIAVNLCNDYFRRSKVRHWKDHDSIDDADDEAIQVRPLKSLAPCPLDQLLGKERKEFLEACIDKLSTEHKTAILLRKEGFKYAEIAEITETTVETVGSRIFYAKKGLWRCLKSYMKGRL